MRILHVTPYYEQAWAYGGIPRVAAALARGLARRGHQVTVCTTDVCDATSRVGHGAQTGQDGVQVEVFANLSNSLAYQQQFYLPRGLRAYLRRHAGGFHVAHLHGYHNLPGVLAARYLGRASVPYVLAPNGTGPRIERRRAAKWLFDVTLGRSVLPGAARVLAVTGAEQRQLEALGVDPARVSVLPNPVQLSEFDDLPAAAPRAGGRTALYLGQLSPRKRLDLVVAAAAQARAEEPDLRLCIAGNDMGSGRTLRRQLRRHQMTRYTRLLGLLQGQDRLAALAAADVVIYPGVDEVFGLVVLEALLCGTPVLVADDCGAAELVATTGGGLALPHGEAGPLAQGILELAYREPARWRRAAAAAAEQIRRRYGADTVCAELEQLYQELLS